jgi:hypothetical protein
MRKPRKIYIIGQTHDNKSLLNKKKIDAVEKKLVEIGFEVINPLTIYKKNKSITTYEAALENIKKLIECKAVYIMPEVSLKSGDNLELKISLDFNLQIFHG